MARQWEAKWNPEKNEQLKAERGLPFEAVLEAVDEGGVLDDIAHPDPARSHQRLLVVAIDGYACAVPYVMDGDVRFFKTICRSRDYHKNYMGAKS
jgi:hypothetical protein